MFPHELPRALEGFEILERLGTGGAAEVFLAKSRAGRLVAIKVLGDHVTYDPELREALALEAKLCSRLVHPAIVQLRAFVDKDDVSALVFEYVPGVSLARLLRFASQRGERLPDRAAWHVLDRVLAALAFAHTSPIVHRDVSPSNVLVDWGGSVKLTDFGMAKMLGVSSATRVGLVKGTPGCMAPEQARGETVTERADVYAAGLLGWQLATGRTPFEKYKDDDVEMLRAMRNPRLPALAMMRPDLPHALHAAFAAALEPNPESRTITAAELQSVLRGHIDVDAGALDLARLLALWRAPLEKIEAAARPEGASLARKDSGPTVRYEEAALALAEGEEVRPEVSDAGTFLEDAPTRAYLRIPSKPSIPPLPPARLEADARPARASIMRLPLAARLLLAGALAGLVVVLVALASLMWVMR